MILAPKLGTKSVLLAAGLMLAATAPLVTPCHSAEPLMATASSIAMLSTFRLRAERTESDEITVGHGTAFGIDLTEFGSAQQRYMLTACHVIMQHDGTIAPELKVELNYDNTLSWNSCHVLAYDVKLDIALLQCDSELPLCTRFAGQETAAGSPVLMIGSPTGVPLQAFDGHVIEHPIADLSAAYVDFFKQGCSGGPVFDGTSHEIIGVAVAGISNGDGAEGMDPHTCLYVPLLRVRQFVVSTLAAPLSSISAATVAALPLPAAQLLEDSAPLAETVELARTGNPVAEPAPDAPVDTSIDLPFPRVQF